MNEEYDMIEESNERYELDEETTMQLLDDTMDDTEESEDETEEETETSTPSESNLSKYLDSQIENNNELDRTPIEFRCKADGVTYTAVVMGKSKNTTNRYVFKVLPEGNLKAFWLEDLKIM